MFVLKPSPYFYFSSQSVAFGNVIIPIHEFELDSHLAMLQLSTALTINSGGRRTYWGGFVRRVPSAFVCHTMKRNGFSVHCYLISEVRDSTGGENSVM